MDPETEKIIKEHIEKLPPEVKKLFTDPALGDKIINIGKKNELNIEQLGTLQTETYLVMLGLVHPDEYQNELKNRLKINDEKANTIIKDVNEQMFVGIREKLKEAYENTDKDLEDIVPYDTEEEKKDTQILNSAGIEIIPDLPAVPSAQLMQAGKLELTTPPPILTQKLSGYVKNDVVETNHSLNNLTPSSIQSVSPAKPTIDPYREIPE